MQSLPRQGRAEALLKVQRLKHALSSASYLQKEHLNVHLTASFGIATFPHTARDKHELLAAADHCLFHSKAAGKNRISVAAPAGIYPMEQEEPSTWVVTE